MHNTAFAACGLDARYEAVELDSSHLETWVASIRDDENTYGFNVTVPHKEAILPHLGGIEGDAELCHAVNTVRLDRTNGIRLVGTNTDTLGFRRSLAEDADTSLRGQRVVILGAGGAARAITVVALQDGASEIVLANRHVERARELLNDLGAVAKDVPVRAVELAEGPLRTALPAATVVVNATSVGMRSQESPLDPELLPRSSLVVDIVYNPRHTALLDGARRRGAVVVEGLGMLVHQAAAAFEIWTGCPAPVRQMRDAAEHALGNP
jgi:shikimate dehydrogenase